MIYADNKIILNTFQNAKTISENPLNLRHLFSKNPDKKHEVPAFAGTTTC